MQAQRPEISSQGAASRQVRAEDPARCPTQSPCPPRGSRRAGIIALLLALALDAHGAGPADAQTPGAPASDSVVGGWQVFARKQCIACHAVWGLGGQNGPDLGRSERQNLTAGQLAGKMWNHIPKMHSYMLRNHLEYPRIEPAEMNDLFSFLLFVPYLDEPGDPAAGQRVLRDRGCMRCHLSEGAAPQTAPDLRRWAAYPNPIVWAQKMWEHAPKMEAAMQQAGMAWPKLDDPDLLNIIAYLRSVGEHETKIYLEPGSVRSGAKLFAERNCRACHAAGGAGGELGRRVLPRSIAGLASRMWNHSPEMTRLMRAQGIERNPLSAQEMADLIAYIISLQYEDRSGDPRRGRIVFEDKRCAQCHAAGQAPSSGRAADGSGAPLASTPTLDTLGAAVTPQRLAYAMWNHGLTMMNRMSESGISWPVFQADETVDVIAYLKSVAPRGAQPPAPQPLGAQSPPVVPRPRPSPPPLPPLPPLPLVRPPPIVAGASCVSNACHPGLIAGRQVHGPTAAGDCSACHHLLDAQAHRFELASNQSELCYRCHEDRGEAVQGRAAIAIGVCTACHNPHSAENLLGPDFSGAERCFVDMVGMTLTLEAMVSRKPPAAGPPGTQPPPAVPPPQPAPPPASPQAAIPSASSVPPMTPSTPAPVVLQGGCVTSQCHPNLMNGQFVHSPSAQKQCQFCHQLTDEKAHRFKLASAQPALCFECHDKPASAAFTHGPVAMGMCTACHNPHSAANKFLLPESGSNLCFVCHAEMRDYVGRARVQHAAVRDKGCVGCHDPHRSAVKFQLKKEVSDLCLDCHPKTREKMANVSVRHDPVDNGRKCVNCHNPHGSNVRNILVNVEMDLCLSCHNKPLNTPNGPIIDMAAWIKDNPERHGPIRNANCTGCHQPHGSNNFRILQYAFPRDFYRSFSPDAYDLCFQCHEKTLVLDQRTTTLTGFRNGDKNLHYMHVNQEKGRTCRACHEIHAGTRPKRIKDVVPFGKWNYAVNFEINKYGGSCAPGCHVPRAYDRRRAIVQK